MKQQQDPLYNRKEAAKFLGVTEGTLAVWKTTKRYPLPVIKIGRLVRYRQSDLLKFLDERTDPQK
jgi:predicted DNA-binding transcriptional regulator AlpA